MTFFDIEKDNYCVEIYDENGEISITVKGDEGDISIYLSEPQRSEFIRKIKELNHE